MTTQILQTGISPQYVQHWTPTMGVREIIQNYLDSRKEFNCRGYLEWVNGFGVARDFGPGLQVRHLALGVSEKGEDARGQYGEGLKLALLAFARLGRYIEIRAQGLSIQPKISYDPQFQTDLLTLELTPLAGRMEEAPGTYIKFACTEEEFLQAKAYFIEFSRRQEDFQWLDRGKISLPGGSLYVNGTKVGTLEDAIFSYHLEGKFTGGNRDRSVVDRDSVAGPISEMLLESGPKVRSILLQALMDPQKTFWERSLSLHHYHIPNTLKSGWRRTVQEIYGRGVLPSYLMEVNVRAQYLGHKLLPQLPWNWNEVLKAVGVPAADSLVAAAKPKLTEVILTPEESACLAVARDRVTKYYFDPKVVKIVAEEDLALWAQVGDGEVLGLYHKEEDTIYLSRHVLQSDWKATSTLLHETVHKYSGATDCTAEFEAALLDVSIKILKDLESH